MPFQLKVIPTKDNLDTAEIIKNQILSSTSNLSYRLLVEDICRNSSYAPDITILKMLYEYGRKHFTYLRDIENQEYVKSADRIYNEILIKGKFVGDCDDATVFMGCLLINAGYLPIIRLIELNNSGYFSHIFCYTIIDENDYICMDIADKQEYFINFPQMTNYYDIPVTK